MKSPVYEQVYQFANLADAARKATKSRWRYRREQALFRVNAGKKLLDIQRQLQHFSYQPQPYRTFYVHDPKKRLICAAPFPDRLVHHVLINVIGPCLQQSFITHSYACLKDRGSHKAIRYAQKNVKRFGYYIHFDVAKYFDSIDHQVLQKLLAKRIKDDKITWLLSKIIAHCTPGSPTGKSVPIGNLTSQYFGNFYLDPMDHLIKDQMAVKGYLRYMDNFLLFHDSKSRLQEISEQLMGYCQQQLSLRLTHTHIHPCYTGVPFLGLRIYPYTKQIQASAWRRFKNKYRNKQQQLLTEEIDEKHFLLSTAAMINNLKRADTYHFRQPFFEENAIEF